MANNVLSKKDYEGTKRASKNCAEHMLMLDEISIETYEALMNIISLLSPANSIELGDGISLKLVDINE